MMNMYHKTALALCTGLLMSTVSLPAMATENSESLFIGISMVDVSNFSVSLFQEKGEQVTTDVLPKGRAIGRVETTQPDYARYRDIKFSDASGKPGKLTFTHTDGKKTVDIDVDSILGKAPTVNNKEGSSEIVMGGTIPWVFSSAAEYTNIPAGDYTDLITVSYDTL